MRPQSLEDGDLGQLVAKHFPPNDLLKNLKTLLFQKLVNFLYTCTVKQGEDTKS